MATASPEPLMTITISAEIASENDRGNDVPSQISPQQRISPPASSRDSVAAPTPPHMSDTTTSSVKSIILTDSEQGDKGRWSWWQGYRRDRTTLGFQAPPGKNVTLATKKAPKRKRRDDD